MEATDDQVINIVFAAFCLSQGIPLVEIDRSDPNKTSFIFETNYFESVSNALLYKKFITDKDKIIKEIERVLNIVNAR